MQQQSTTKILLLQPCQKKSQPAERSFTRVAWDAHAMGSTQGKCGGHSSLGQKTHRNDKTRAVSYPRTTPPLSLQRPEKCIPSPQPPALPSKGLKSETMACFYLIAHSRHGGELGSSAVCRWCSVPWSWSRSFLALTFCLRRGTKYWGEADKWHVRGSRQIWDVTRRLRLVPSRPEPCCIVCNVGVVMPSLKVVGGSEVLCTTVPQSNCSRTPGSKWDVCCRLYYLRDLYLQMLIKLCV